MTRWLGALRPDILVPARKRGGNGPPPAAHDIDGAEDLTAVALGRVEAEFDLIGGFVAGPNQSREDPLGKRGRELHGWHDSSRPAPPGDAGRVDQDTSVRYGERLAELGAVPSIGSVGDSFNNALAETVNGYCKAELIRGPTRQQPWKTVEDVELATLGWVHWHNTRRLHGYLDDRPPLEYEQKFYAAHGTDQSPVGIP